MHKYILLALVLVLHGCATTSSTTTIEEVETDKIYNVVIEGKADLTGDVKNESNVLIGEVLTNKTSSSGVTVAKVSIDHEYDELIKTNSIFYASDGDLIHAKLNDDAGEPLEEGDKVMGFTGKTQLYWHKTKSAIKGATNATISKAQELYKSATQ